MPNSILFMDNSWDDYCYWQTQDRKTLKRINTLLQEICRNGHEGAGSPEPLRHEQSGWWSRRIDIQNRLVYRIDDNVVVVLSCRSHYDDL